MTALTNAKLPIGLVAAIVGQAMGLAFWISGLQGDVATANAAATAAQAEVARLEEIVDESVTSLAILNDQQKQINAEHAQIGDSFKAIWDEIDAKGVAPVPTGTKRDYGY
jgi:phosphoenolpyruvate-protein kinase (PTS system EI component)